MRRFLHKKAFFWLAFLLCLNLAACNGKKEPKPQELVSDAPDVSTAVEETQVEEPTYAEEETIATEDDEDTLMNTLDAEGEISIELELPPEEE